MKPSSLTIGLALIWPACSIFGAIAQIEPNQNKDQDPGNDIIPDIVILPPDFVKKVRFELFETAPIQWVAPELEPSGADLVTESITMKFIRLELALTEGAQALNTVVFQTTVDLSFDQHGFVRVDTPVTLSPGLYDLTFELAAPGASPPEFAIAQFTLDPLQDLPIDTGPFHVLGGDLADQGGPTDTLMSAQIGFVPAPGAGALLAGMLLANRRRR